jgi:hypothetical protein
VRYSAELLKLSRLILAQGASNFFNELNNSIFSKLAITKVVYIFCGVVLRRMQVRRASVRPYDS